MWNRSLGFTRIASKNIRVLRATMRGKLAALAAEIDESDDDDPEDFLPEDFVDERENMEPAELWDRVIADLIEIERRTGGRDKSPTTAIIDNCLDARRTTVGKDRP
jgi:hypothetical protein